MKAGGGESGHFRPQDLTSRKSWLWLLGPAPGAVGCGLGCAPDPQVQLSSPALTGGSGLAEPGRLGTWGYPGEGGVTEVFQKEVAVCISVPAAAWHEDGSGLESCLVPAWGSSPGRSCPDQAQPLGSVRPHRVLTRFLGPFPRAGCHPPPSPQAS